MKVLLVMDSFFTGGAEFSTLELFSFLKENQVEIKICKLKQMNPEYDPSVFGLDSGSIVTLSPGSFRQKRSQLRKIINDFQPDIVHSVLFKSNLMVRSLRMLSGKFIHLESLVNHTYSSDRLKESGVTPFKLEMYRLLDKYTSVFGTDHFHPNGYSVAGHYREKLGISDTKMTVVHRGREASKYETEAADKIDFSIDENRLVLINVARQEYQKGQDVLLKALSFLPKETREKFCLLIVGREGKMTNDLHQMVTDFQLQDCVSFLGHRTDIPSLLKMADVFVFPSRFEGLPGVLIEAEASGLPVICTDLPMMREVVVENENALLFEIDDAYQLAEAIQKMTDNQPLREAFALRSKEIFKNNFQIEMVHERMLSLYQNLTGR